MKNVLKSTRKYTVVKKTPLEKQAEKFIRDFPKGTYVRPTFIKKENISKKKLKRKRGAQFKV